MELGICVRDEPVADLVNLGRFADDHGYAEIWVPDGARGAQLNEDGKLTGRDAFCGLAAMFAATKTVRGGVGVAAAPMHLPITLSMLASTLTELSDDRFSLGVGVSHPELTARHGIDFPGKPVGFMRDWLQELRRYSNEEVAYGGGWPVLLAALGPQMVKLGSQHSDGLVLNWLTPEHAAKSISDIRSDAPEGSEPQAVLYLRLMPLEAAQADATMYDGLANYHRHFQTQGLNSRAEIVEGTTLSIEDLGKARERIEQYRESGLDLLCLYPNAMEPDERNRVLAALTV